MSSADALAWSGAVAGWLAPLTIGTFVVAGGRRRRSYDPWRDTMTDLGDGTDGVASAFVAVNLVVAVLLGVFAWSAQRTLESWPIAIVLGVAAAGSFVFGLTACDRRCRRPLDKALPEERVSGRGCGDARPGRIAPAWIPRVHLAAALVVIVDIIAAPFLAVFALRDGHGDVAPLTTVGPVLGGAALVLTVMFAQQTAIKKRADKAGAACAAVPGLFERLVWTAGYGWLVTLACVLVRPGWPALLALGLWLAIALRFVLVPGWRDPSPEFSLSACQPGTLRTFKGARCAVFRVGAVDDAPTFQRQLTGALATGLIGPVPDNASSAVTVAVTARGLRRLGVPYRWRAPFVGDAFDAGMLARAGALGDTGPNDPTHWDEGWRDPDKLHIAFWLQATNPEALEELDRRVSDQFSSVRTTVCVRTDQLRHDGAPPNGKHRYSTEHFGFADGISQPWIEGVGRGSAEPKHGGAKRGPHDRWKPIALGEFVLGQVDETGDIFPVPTPAEVFLGGTFLVARKLEQDVAGFRRFAGSDDANRALAPRLIGRTRLGDPLAPQDPVAPPASDRDQLPNRFGYGHDPEGLQCPLGAHIRRANPRDALGFGSTLSVRRRLLRRGMPYGPRFDDRPDAERGLLFLACTARIAEQFEFIQSQWLNDGSAFGVGNAPDPVGGNWPAESRRTLIVQGRPPVVRAGLQAFATTKGGEYFFVPALSGLHAIAKIPTADAPTSSRRRSG